MKNRTWLLLLTICLCFTFLFLETGNQIRRADAEQNQGGANLSGVFLLLLSSSDHSVTASASGSPTSGVAPLSVSFTSDTSSGEIIMYRWDFDGDGEWNWDDDSPEDQEYTYSAPGLYTAVLQVEDAEGNTDTEEIDIIVHDDSGANKPSVTFSANAKSLFTGQTATLSWSVKDAETVTILPEVGSVSLADSTSVLLTSSTRYTLTATGVGGSQAETVDINVVSPAVDDLMVYINSPAQGERVASSTATIQGIVNPAGAEVYVNGISATVVDENFTVQVNLLPGTNSLTATVAKDGQIVQDTSWVVLGYTRENQAEGSFGEVYEELIPDDSLRAVYEKEKFAVITGLVENDSGASLSGVSTSILNHPEYGTSITDDEGRFALPVEGGTTYTLVYEHPSYISSQRQIIVPTNSIPVAELVQLVMLDSKSTTVTFDNNPETIVTHTSTLITDSFGSRSTTMVFKGDNPAWEVDKQGQRIRKLDTIVTRATEFTAPETMPSVLPPSVAFTYCADLTVDGAARVEFDQPVAIWVDNFLSFPVGTTVPIGYYDRDKGSWKPADNGMVVQLLDTNEDGIVDALDATGDGERDDLDGDGNYEDEVTGLGNSFRYKAGDTFWRGEVAHFTPWDLNWPQNLPDGFIRPDIDNIDYSDSDADSMSDPEYDSSAPKDRQSDKSGCRIEPYGRILNEEIYIPGTDDVLLSYKTSRTKGYGSSIKIPVIGDSIPDSLTQINVSLYVGGHETRQILYSPESNATVSFSLPSEDLFGNELVGEVKVRVKLQYVYDTTYAVPERFQGQVFGEFGKEPLGVNVRSPFSVSDYRSFTIIKKKTGANLNNGFPEGWTLSSHHRIEPTAPFHLIKGDGTTVRGTSGLIDTVIGGGATGCDQDLTGTLALDADFDNASGITQDSKGNLYFSSYRCNQVYKMDSDGYLTRIAGKPGTSTSYNTCHTDTDEVLGDGGPATDAALCGPMGLAFDKDDNLYIADTYHRRVRKVNSSGVITTVMGNGFPELTYGDFTEFSDRCMHNCTKNDNTLGRFRDLAVDYNGNIYLSAGEGLNAIGKITTNGIYHTIGGACNPNDQWSGGVDNCTGGEGDYANDVALNPSGGIAYGANGSVYFIDDWGRSLRTISSTGVYSTVVDVGSDFTLSGLSLDPNGNVYVIDREQNFIYRIDISGNITRVAGTGERSSSGDGGFALDAQINAWTSSGIGSGSHYSNSTLYFADGSSGRFRSIRGVSFSLESFKEAEDDLVFAEDNSLVHIFNATGRHKKTVNSETGVTLRTFQYSENRLQSITDQFGQATTLQYDQSGVLASITSSTGVVTNLTIDADNNLTQIVFDDNSDFTFTYDENNLMLSKTEPTGNVFTHEYNAIGKLINVSDELGGSWGYEVETVGSGSSRITITTAEGNSKTIQDTYTATGSNVTETTYPSGDVDIVTRENNKHEATLANGMKQTARYMVDQEFGYIYQSQVTTETPEESLLLEVKRTKDYADTNADNVIDTFISTVSIHDRDTVSVLDRLNSTVTVTSAEGRQATQTFSPSTLQPLTSQFGGLAQVSYAYDARGNLTQVNQGARELTHTYDLYNNLATKTLPEGQVTSFTHDIFGRVTSVIRPGNIVTGFGYDANGMVNKITTPIGSEYTFSYNKANKIADIILPDIIAPGDGGSYQFDYDMDRHVTTITYPSSGTITNTYTGDRLTAINTSDGTIISTEYESDDRVKKQTRGSNSVAYTYDGALLLNTTYAGALTQTISRTYNEYFQLENLSYAGVTQWFEYDGDGLLVRVGDDTYIDRDNNTSAGLPDSVKDDFCYVEKLYNNYGEQSEEHIEVYNANNSSVVESSWSVTRNGNSQIVTLAEDFNSASSFQYFYDDLGHLSTVKKGDTIVESYSYDANGNRTLDNENNAYTYDAQDRLTGKGSILFSYTADGFLASRDDSGEVTSYDYSLTGELQQVTLPDSTVISYTYDPLGRRITKAINGSIVEKYLWYSKTLLLAVYDGSDTLKYRFEYADKEVPLRMIDNSGATYYYIGDHLGSLRQVVDEESNVVRSIDYDSFGRILEATGAKSDIPFGFAGGLYDADTGLIHFGFRDYNPEIGRWTARDPILFGGKSSNLYAYVKNDPVNLTDRMGLSSKKEGPPPPQPKYDDFSFNPFTWPSQLEKRALDAIWYVNDTYARFNNIDDDEEYEKTVKEHKDSRDKARGWRDVVDGTVNLLTNFSDPMIGAINKFWGSL